MFKFSFQNVLQFQCLCICCWFRLVLARKRKVVRGRKMLQAKTDEGSFLGNKNYDRDFLIIIAWRANLFSSSFVE